MQYACRLPCSIGLSGDKSTAKYASDLQEPNGLTIIPPWEARERLRDMPVTELCRIGHGIGNYLAKRGVHTFGDMERLPISELACRFGDIGRRIWLMAQGMDPHHRADDSRSGKVVVAANLPYMLLSP